MLAKILPTGNCISCVMFLSQTACQRGWIPRSNLLPSLLPKLPNLVPTPLLREQPNLLPRWQPSMQPSLQPESPFQWPLLSMCRKSANRACPSVELDMHSNRQFPGLFVVHMPSCLHVLLVTRPLCSLRGRGNRLFWYVPPGVLGYRGVQVVTFQEGGG